MTEESKRQALSLMKTRLNRPPGETVLDDYFLSRLEAARMDYEKQKIILGDSINDVLMLVDKAVYDYQNRDKEQGEPKWLRERRKGRWI